MTDVTMSQDQTRSFLNLQGHQYMSLTTFRKTGQPVPTPVWFAQSGENLYVMTSPDSGKVKRIRSNAQVEVAPCTRSGEVLGASAEAAARVLSPEEAQVAKRALDHKYGLQKKFFEMMGRMRGGQSVYLEITPMS
jgi:PPOX class probable F420-dependent enzyme